MEVVVHVLGQEHERSPLGAMMNPQKLKFHKNVSWRRHRSISLVYKSTTVVRLVYHSHQRVVLVPVVVVLQLLRSRHVLKVLHLQKVTGVDKLVSVWRQSRIRILCRKTQTRSKYLWNLSSFRAANVYHPIGRAPMALVVHVLGWEHIRWPSAAVMQPKKFKFRQNVSLSAYRSI
jgi:hypothetical protein